MKAMTQAAGHVVLLGDSIFDNAAYTSGAPDVVTHLRTLLPAGWRVTLLARDGAVTADLGGQLRRVPPDATHLVVSIGGNDVLRNLDLLSLRVASTADALDVFGERVAAFERAYRQAVGQATSPAWATAVCTVYNGALDESVAARARTTLALFNDVIYRVAVGLRTDVLELRTICTEPGDYANPIEPSGQGGAKIAAAIAAAVGGLPSAIRPSHLWGLP